MTAHMRSVAAVLSPSGLWDTGFQFGDWLDPDAPADDPGKSKGPVRSRCDRERVSARRTLMAEAAAVLGEAGGCRRVLAPCATASARRSGRTTSQGGRVASDSATAYALAIVFDLLEDGDRQRPVIASPSSSATPGTASAPASPARRSCSTR